MHIAYQVLGEGPLDLLAFSTALIPIDTVDDEPSLAASNAASPRLVASFVSMLAASGSPSA